MRAYCLIGGILRGSVVYLEAMTAFVTVVINLPRITDCIDLARPYLMYYCNAEQDMFCKIIDIDEAVTNGHFSLYYDRYKA